MKKSLGIRSYKNLKTLAIFFDLFWGCVENGLFSVCVGRSFFFKKKDQLLQISSIK